MQKNILSQSRPLLKTHGFTRHVLFIALLGLLLNLSACNTSSTPPSTSASIVVFGTVVDIVVYGVPAKTANPAITQVEQTFQTMHHEWHAWEKGGIVSKINQAIANNQPIKVADSVKSFILRSQVLSQQSQGLFDPGIGSLIGLWGFHSENWQGPPPLTSQNNTMVKVKTFYCQHSL